MTDEDIRNLIEEDLKEKMLGPGFAKDLILCSDTKEEIIPIKPKEAYSIGVLLPLNCSEEEANEDVDIPIDVLAQNNDENNDDVLVVEDDEDDRGKVEDKEDEIEDVSMFSHIGLFACLSSDTTEVELKINYGKYKKLSLEESKKQVKVLTGKFTQSIEDAINNFAENKNIQEVLEEDKIPNLRDCISINKEEQTISLTASLSKKPSKILKIPNKDFPVEAIMVNTLINSPHYKRTHIEHTNTISLADSNNGEIEYDSDIKIFWSSFVFNDKKFIKVLLRNIGKRSIFQPQIIFSANNGRIESYVEPITLSNDTENNINEFIYRNVRNYGKGVNCAIDWEEDENQICKKVFTTFTPTIDVEKFSNQVSKEYNNNNIEDACILRNLSIWTELDNNTLIAKLTNFVEGYATWQEKQQNSVNGNDEQAKSILEKQKELLERLNDNIRYLQEKNEALECFKIANTAMLLQMVVARHPSFKKDRDLPQDNPDTDIYTNLEYFSKADYSNEISEPKYFPFQLAFLLMNVKSTFEIEDKYHKDIVDLIWFPTGGGKTEAYLALTALTIVHRRRQNPRDRGVSVIMRYTLRLLTSQQFERASYLICALEFLRRYNTTLNLGTNEISIGLYVGEGVTPNRIADLTDRSKYREFLNGNNNNPFPITYCPWCGTRLKNTSYYETGKIECINGNCCFNDDYNLPIYYIDENIYTTKPTLLFATVDKLAGLANNQAAARLLLNDPPNLIIQDELHLLIGALGSIVGLYESVIEALIKKNGSAPKIIASTATTRNTENLIKNLYNRNVAIFPPQGIEYNDNYFSHVDKESKRRHVGMMSSQHISSNFAENRLIAFLLLARVKVFKKFMEEQGKDWLDSNEVNEVCCQENTLIRELDNYWTSVLYFNSLKDLGRSKSRVSQEVRENFRAHKYLYQIPKSLWFIESGFDNRVLEFTSRIQSHEIKGFLNKASSSIELTTTDNNQTIVSSGSDLIFASNMISVGIDINRWNLMLMVGQPRSTSEYIQSSSRVARTTFGLVLNLFNPKRIRELSLFENYIPFHKTYYKSVEPLSITPLTESTINHKIINNMIKIYRTHITTDTNAAMEDLANDMIGDIFEGRFEMDDDLKGSLIRKIEAWDNNAERATALRNVEVDAFTKIRQIDYDR